jgi:hypothetical protein
LRRKFILRNDRQERLATVLYFYEEHSKRYVGIIFTKDFTKKQTWFYQDEEIEDVIADLAAKFSIQYHEFIEVD